MWPTKFMSPTRDERLDDFRNLHERVLWNPENFGSFLGELHKFLHDLYEAAATVDDDTDGFDKALRTLCVAKSIDGWQEILTPDEQRKCFKDGHDPEARRVIDFWTELDEPLRLW
jgi:hypothetical protein